MKLFEKLESNGGGPNRERQKNFPYGRSMNFMNRR